MKDRVNALRLELLAIRRKLARILLIIFIRTELHGIHEHRRDDHIARRTRRAAKRHVPLMQRSHRRAETDALACRFHLLAVRLYFRNCRHDLQTHGKTPFLLAAPVACLFKYHLANIDKRPAAKAAGAYSSLAGTRKSAVPFS